MLVFAGTLTVLPARTVQLAPLSNDALNVVPVSVPTVAEPFASERLTLVAVVLVLLNATVKVFEAPSLTVSPATEVTRGLSSSTPPLPVPSSLIVPSPVAVPSVALLALLRLTLKVSAPS